MTAPALTVLAFKRCMEVDWEKTATKAGVVSYDFKTGEVVGLKKDSVQIDKCACGSGCSSPALTLAEFRKFFGANR